MSENVTCFGKLKEYLDSKAQMDVTISYEEYKQQNLNASTLVVNYPNGEKSVSTIFRDKGPIVVEEEDTLNK